ncbi:MAG: chloride channel protein [Phycisphaerales bacterium]|nr:MAG: chloride channel protein [Phycisphaerales bacterium]
MPPSIKWLAARGQRQRVRLTRLLAAIGFKDDYFLIVLAILIGGATGYGAHLFYLLLEKGFEFAYHEDHGIYAGRVIMLVILPTVGALAVGFITYWFAREAKGHGVPEVMDAILRRGGVVRPRVAVAKSIASALTIGSGGSAGTEGPIIQIGAAIGSTVGQVFNVDRRQMGVLVACGAAGGIAAIFNAPIAGVLFALEIFLKDFSFRTFSPVVFSSVLSASLTHALRGEDRAIFEIQALSGDLFRITELPYYAVLGVLCAVASVIFIRMLYRAEDIADVIRIPEPLKPALGAVLLGLCGVLFVTFSHRPEMPLFFGNGYPTIQGALNLNVFEMGLLFLVGVFVLKVIATCLTLGSGGSGGIFAPSLMMGVAVGGSFGLALHTLGFIDQPAHVVAYALVGMAAMVAGTTHAPLTAIVILYELTREPRVIVPIMFAAIVATAGAQLLCRDSIYTLKLRRRGVRMGTLADLTILKRITADQVRVTPTQFVHPDDSLHRLLELAEESEAPDFVVVDEESVYQGLVVADDIKTALLQPEAVPLLVVGELLRSGVPAVRPDETLDSIMDKFARNDVHSLPLTAPGDSTHIEGLITRQAVMTRYQEELDRQSG